MSLGTRVNCLLKIPKSNLKNSNHLFLEISRYQNFSQIIETVDTSKSTDGIEFLNNNTWEEFPNTGVGVPHQETCVSVFLKKAISGIKYYVRYYWFWDGNRTNYIGFIISDGTIVFNIPEDKDLDEIFPNIDFSTTTDFSNIVNNELNSDIEIFSNGVWRDFEETVTEEDFGGQIAVSPTGIELSTTYYVRYRWCDQESKSDYYGDVLSKNFILFDVPEDVNDNRLHFEITLSTDPTFFEVSKIMDSSINQVGFLVFDGEHWIAFQQEGIGTPYYSSKIAVRIENVPGDSKYYVNCVVNDGVENTDYIGNIYCIYGLIGEYSFGDMSSKIRIIQQGTRRLSSIIEIYYPSNLSAKVKISYYAIKNLPCIFAIPGYKELRAKVKIWNRGEKNLGSKIYLHNIKDLGAKIKIIRSMTKNLSAKVFIIWRSISAKVKIVDVYSLKDLGSKIKIVSKSDKDLRAGIAINYGNDIYLRGRFFIPRNEDFGGKIGIYDEDNFGHIPEFNRNFGAKIKINRLGYKNIGAKINMEESITPVPIIVPAQNGTIWRDSNIVSFSWWIPSVAFEIDACYTKLDQNPNTVFDENTFKRMVVSNESFNLEQYSGAGIYYFHIAAKDEYGRMSETAHAQVMYNHIPSIPTTPLLINKENVDMKIVIVPKNENVLFEWGRSLDLDPLDILRYTIQISSDIRFRNDDIIHTSSNIREDSVLLNVLFDDYLTYYFRVRCNDGHQDTDWGPIGSFKVNRPPGTPKNLAVR